MTEHGSPPPTDERPAKRARLEGHEPKQLDESQLQKELKAGITAYVSPDTPGFSGVLKQRYTDFLVNEILPNGRVLHFDGDDLPKADGSQKSDNGVVEDKSAEKKQETSNDTAEARSKGKKKETSSDIATVQSEEVEQEIGEGTVNTKDQQSKGEVQYPEQELTAAKIQEAEERITTYINKDGEEVSFQVISCLKNPSRRKS
jgi:tRNA pseudouridine13 synthase